MRARARSAFRTRREHLAGRAIRSRPRLFTRTLDGIANETFEPRAVRECGFAFRGTAFADIEYGIHRVGKRICNAAASQRELDRKRRIRNGARSKCEYYRRTIRAARDEIDRPANPQAGDRRTEGCVCDHRLEFEELLQTEARNGSRALEQRRIVLYTAFAHELPHDVREIVRFFCDAHVRRNLERPAYDGRERIALQPDRARFPIRRPPRTVRVRRDDRRGQFVVHAVQYTPEQRKAAFPGNEFGMRMLALNAGSRSHIAKLYDFDEPATLEPPRPAWDASDESAGGSFERLLGTFIDESPDAVVHRFVHPGPELANEIAFDIDDRARALLKASDLAPSHNPLALEGLEAATKRFPNAQQIGISDVVLHDDAPALATTYAVPYAWREKYGVRRYGFHGISHRDVLERSAHLSEGADDDRRTISVHLGSGCSLVAAHGRKILDSTMGMTPFDGLMMGSRSGSIDPGIVFTLLRRGAFTLDELEQAIGNESGLKGVSAVSSDTRELRKAIDAGNERAAFAIDLYAYAIRKHIGAMTAVLGGLDVLAFTGPVGAHDAAVRRTVCDALAYLGISIQEERNDEVPPEGTDGPDVSIETNGARVRVQVIRTLEEWAMVRGALAVYNH